MKLKDGRTYGKYQLPTYHSFARITLKAGERGYMYKLCNRLTDAQREDASKRRGITVLSTSPQYAPEMRNDAIFIKDGISVRF